MTGVGQAGSVAAESRLSRAYSRILRVTIALSVIITLAATLLAGWRSGLGAAIGASVGFINFVWLHHGTERLVKRMLTSGNGARSKFRFVLPSSGRYLLVIAVTYVILKSYPGLLVGFLVGLILPIIASMGEGIYEAVTINKVDQASS